MGHLYLCNSKRLKGESDVAMSLATQALSQFEQCKDVQGVAWASGSICAIYYILGNYPEALNCFSKSAEIWKKTDDKQGMTLYYSYIADIDKHQGDYLKALENHLMALHIREEIGFYRREVVGKLDLPNQVN